MWRRGETCGVLAAVLWIASVGFGLAQDFFTLKGHGGPVKGIAVGADGTIVTASFDNSVGVWRDGIPQWLEGHDAAVNAVIYPGEGRIVSAGDDFSLRLWDDDGGHVLGRHLGKVVRLALSPDGTRVASASWDGTARIWPLAGDAPPVVIEGHGGSVNDAVFSPDGARLYTASADGTIRVWNADTGEALGQLVHHGFGVNALAMAADGAWLAYGAVDGGTRVLALPGGKVIGDFTLDRRPILALAHHPGRQRIAVGDAEGYIMMLDTVEWRIADDFRATLKGPVWALVFSFDGANIHAGGLDNAMYSWPVDDLDGVRIEDAGQSYLTPPEEMSNGERQFQRKCSICHTLGPDGGRRAGPTLHGLFGRKAGSMTGYPYSERLVRGDIVWSEETVDQLFDLGPDHFIPGSKMPMQRITGEGDRADLIAFLKTATAQ
ncbi:c-type cytochrome [Defluviimonas sp. WL0050]|uniref:C-type cytochrome n=1 Tax=Albidovulum litorale TaxID=2984134 RepID=A0ABT2ZT46_9RHOB|nr:c-type cytochrome [Defluviimonas sp. WL0050]MCV2874333.1 c-type cytochrome [Defluviimonas sp. WL0050]